MNMNNRRFNISLCGLLLTSIILFMYVRKHLEYVTLLMLHNFHPFLLQDLRNYFHIPFAFHIPLRSPLKFLNLILAR